MWLYFLLGTASIIMGLLVHKGKAYFLISGYNTYSKEKKKNVDVVSIAKYMGYYGYLNGVVAYIGGVLTVFEVKNIAGPVIAFFLISTGVLLVKLQKYDGNMFDKEGKLKKEGKRQLMVTGIITLATVLFVGAVMFFSTRPTQILLNETSLEIQGMYGEEVQYGDIETLKLLEKLPAITMRTNGSAVGAKLKGHFNTKEYGSAKLFLDKSKPPYIFMETKSRIFIFNLSSAEETRQLFNELMNR